MSQRLSENDFGLKLYERFPKQYQLDDVAQKFTLKRYMQTAGDGGFKFIIQDANGILDIVNPSTTEKSVLYALYEQYGLEMFNGIPEEYMRALLPYLGSAWEKKGSLDIIEFVASTLSGIKVETVTTYKDDHTSLFGEALFGDAIFGNTDKYSYPVATVKLDMDFALSDYFPDTVQFKRILKNFVPFYVYLILVYSYVYSDEAGFTRKEYSFDNIIDTKEENRKLGIKEVTSYTMQLLEEEEEELSRSIEESNAVFQDGSPFGYMLFGYTPNTYNITDNKTENSELKSQEYSLNNIGDYKEETIKTKMAESDLDTLKFKDIDAQVLNHYMNSAIMGSSVLDGFLLGFIPIEDNIRTDLLDTQALGISESCISTIGEMSERNCTMNVGVFNLAVLGDESFDYSSVPY